MGRRHRLADAQWQQIEPLPPVHGKPGGQWVDRRRVINGVLFRARTGVPSGSFPSAPRCLRWARSPVLDKTRSRQRNTVGRCVNKRCPLESLRHAWRIRWVSRSASRPVDPG
ncbi:transposase [Streptomyces chattanoogensis]|uniref:transposase n=1 Tax=Streptomyces chattanoogensis TaxID=66876 RepID=UPI003682CE67